MLCNSWNVWKKIIPVTLWCVMQYLDCVEENNNRLRFGVLCNTRSVWKKIITGYGLVCYTIPGVSGTIKKIVTGYALVCYAIAEVSGKNKTG